MGVGLLINMFNNLNVLDPVYYVSIILGVQFPEGNDQRSSAIMEILKVDTVNKLIYVYRDSRSKLLND